MSKRMIAAAVLAAIALSLTLACTKANPPESQKPSAANSGASTAPSPAAGASSAAANSAGSTSSTAMKIDLTVDPPQPNPSKPAKFTVNVADSDGKPVGGADVNVALVMKEMDMGKNEFKLADKGNGQYQGEGKFGMSGDWNVVVTAKQSTKTGQNVVTQGFAVKSVMPKP